MQVKHIKVIDSHTGGEPTRIIIDGGPVLGSGTLAEQRTVFETQFDEIRSAVIHEPRGSDVLVGGLLCQPVHPQADFGIIFFNAAGFLGMCGHGTIGFMETLKYLGKIEFGEFTLDTPVGLVRTKVDEGGVVSVKNVPSYRHLAGVSVNVPGYGTVLGDVAWGGNWFFLVKDSPESLKVSNTDHLMSVTKKIRDAVAAEGITGAGGAYIDHVELFGAPEDPHHHSRNFVLCPGNAYDRSPCGTGTSAKLACLAADGVLSPGEPWRQESIIGSVFECHYELNSEQQVVPTIQGTAHVCAESTLILNPNDPFCMGIRD